MIDLNTWLAAINPAAAADWTLTTAVGITDTGLIVGDGMYNDGPGGLSDGDRAFILDASALVPEPNSLCLLAVAAVGLVRKRRR